MIMLSVIGKSIEYIVQRLRHEFIMVLSFRRWNGLKEDRHSLFLYSDRSIDMKLNDEHFRKRVSYFTGHMYNLSTIISCHQFRTTSDRENSSSALFLQNILVVV